MKLNGPGKYDAETQELLERLEAKGIMLLVFDAERGSGVSAKGSMEFMARLPKVLENLAAELRRDLKARTM